MTRFMNYTSAISQCLAVCFQWTPVFGTEVRGSAAVERGRKDAAKMWRC